MFFVTRQCLLSGGDAGTVGIVDTVDIINILITSTTLIIILDIFGNFRSVITSFRAGFSPRLGVVPATKGAVIDSTPRLISIQRVPRVTITARYVRSLIVITCGNHRAVFALGNISSSFTRLARVSSYLCNSSRFYLRTKKLRCNVFNDTNVRTLNDGTQTVSCVGICTTTQRKRCSLSSTSRDFIMSSLLLPTYLFSMKRRQCSEGIILTPVTFTHQLFFARNRVADLRLHLTANISLDTAGGIVTRHLNESCTILSHFRRRTSACGVVRVRGIVTCLFLIFVLIITYFGVVDSVSVLVVSGHSSATALHGVNTGSERVTRVFFLRKTVVALLKTILNIVVNLLLYFLRRRCNFIDVNDTSVCIIRTCPIDIRCDSITVVLTAIVTVKDLTITCPIATLAHAVQRRGWFVVSR